MEPNERSERTCGHCPAADWVWDHAALGSLPPGEVPRASNLKGGAQAAPLALYSHHRWQ